MRKLILQMQMSLDGFVSAGPNDEQKWVTWALAKIHDDVLRIGDNDQKLILAASYSIPILQVNG